LRYDNGGEFTSKEFMEYCNIHGIKWKLSIERTPQQNGVVERKNMTIQKMAQIMIMDNYPSFWGFIYIKATKEFLFLKPSISEK
jgi:transposase InsO family protein